MNSVLMVILAIVCGIICFIAGMIVELFINSRELKATRDELLYTKGELYKLHRQLEEGVEIIEIHDNTIKDENLFEPW